MSDNVTHSLTSRERFIREGLNEAMDLVFETEERAGWHKDPVTGEPLSRDFPTMIALMHSELSEALEADRKGLMDEKLKGRDAREVELADAVIRILATARAFGLDVAGAFVEKNRYNLDRSDHKPENRTAPGGKSY